MLLPYALVGCLLRHHHFVPVELPSLWSIHYLVLRVDFLHCARMTSEILLLTEICSQVIVEPELQPVDDPDEYSLATSNTQDGAHLDVAMNGFWGSQSDRCFIDVRVYNPYAASNKCSSLSAAYRKHENIKRHAYGQRIREVECASFTPLVLSATGGLAHEATIFYKMSGFSFVDKVGG